MPFNFDYSFKKNGKIIFVQNADGFRWGDSIVRFVNNHIKFPEYYFHYKDGGHVAALHRHIEHKFFFRIDFKNFFYSISRNRVAAALHRAGYRRARTAAKWSCVKNPVDNNICYALPIGFVQSSALATMALMGSNVATVLDNAGKNNIYVSVYMDDLIGSSNDYEDLIKTFGMIIDACATANLLISERKLVAPCAELQAFNCHLSYNHTSVTESRKEQFHSAAHSTFSVYAFEAYCASVASRNGL